MLVELRGKSQITIPKEIVVELGLKTGDKFEIALKNGSIYLIPVVVYPKVYVQELEREIEETKRDIKEGKRATFNTIEALIDELDSK